MERHSQSSGFEPQSSPVGSFSSLLETQVRSSFVPSGPEISQTTRYVDEKAEEIRCIDIEIAQLRDTLFKLEEKRVYLQRCHDQAKGLFAPIRRLPVDILERIFLLFAKPQLKFYREQYSTTPSTVTEVLRLSQVCNRWRDVTKIAPRLWASGKWGIDLTESGSYIDLISHFLLMSKSVPLDLSIGVYRPDPRVDILRMLLHHSERWHSAEFAFIGNVWEAVDSELRRRPRPGNAYFPSLQKLSLHGRGFISLTGSDEFIELFENAPNLTSLTLNGNVTAWEAVVSALRTRPLPVNGYFPRLQKLYLYCRGALSFTGGLESINLFENCPNLTSLTLEKVEHPFTFPFSQLKLIDVSEDSLHILPKCSNVEELVICVSRRLSHSHLSMSFPTYHSLSVLKLRCLPSGWPDEMFSWAFRNFTLPSLTVLHIDITRSVAIEWPSEDFKSMISRSACALQTVHLDFDGPICLNRAQLREFFHMTSTLVGLKVVSYVRASEHLVNTVALFDLLTIKRSTKGVEDVLLPHLSDFEMVVFLDDELEDGFVDMVKSRRKSLIPGVAFLDNLKFFVLGSNSYESPVRQASVTARIQSL